ncbi:unnamed protein product [Rhizophagus irregularis]|nr:unnamed protein product [Rhizophagus irregularis]
MIEVSTGKPPHGKIPHDENLALAICDGLRPTVAKGTPKCYTDLVNRCLSANPDERPSSKEILKVIRNWRFHSDHEKVLHSKRKSVCKDVAMSKEFIETVKDKDESELSSTETILHPKAIYISRPMKYNSLYCEPKNSSGTQIENSIFSDLQLNELNELLKYNKRLKDSMSIKYLGLKRAGTLISSNRPIVTFVKFYWYIQ